MVERKLEGNEDYVALFAGLFPELETNRTILEVFQEVNTVQ